MGIPCLNQIDCLSKFVSVFGCDQCYDMSVHIYSVVLSDFYTCGYRCALKYVQGEMFLAFVLFYWSYCANQQICIVSNVSSKIKSAFIL